MKHDSMISPHNTKNKIKKEDTEEDKDEEFTERS
jgi:hypothetical protein